MKNKPINIYVPNIGKYLLIDGFIVELDPKYYNIDPKYYNNIDTFNDNVDKLINMGFKQIDQYKFTSVPFVVTSITKIHKSIHNNDISYSFPKLYNKDNLLGSIPWRYYYYRVEKFDNAAFLDEDEIIQIKKNKVEFLKSEGFV